MTKDKKQMTNDLEVKRHSLSHILAAAVLSMFPEAKLGIGPATRDGFYYDFDLPRTLIPEDLPLLEAKMKELIKQKLKFEKTDVEIKKALNEAKKEGQGYKAELISDLAQDGVQKVSFYKTGDFVDLCAGPHVSSTEELDPKAFKLSSIAGAYWRGNEKNKMLQRIYGLAFENKNELAQYEKERAEAAKRDHRILGKQLDLFTFSELVGPGLPLFTPKGTIIIEELKKYVESACRKYGFQKISTPGLAKIDLFETSGHAQKFGDELFHVNSDNTKNLHFALRPVTCPHMTQVYASKIRSYRDLPIRYMESDKMFRAEKTGEVGGLNRVYAITVEDGHTFCRIDQIKEEVKNLVKIIIEFYSKLGMMDEFWVSLSFRDPKTPEKYIGDKEDWDESERILKEISDEMNLKGVVCEGEAALYGPKLDFQFRSVAGKEFAIPTVQLDFSTPKRFGLKYIDQKGEEVSPVMVHRAILGSYERFLVILIEHFAGAFPLWLAPVQARVLTVSDAAKKFAETVMRDLAEAGIRAELDTDNETVGKKIRDAELQKIPYILVVGEKEAKSSTVAVRKRGQKEIKTEKVEKFIKNVEEEIKGKNEVK